MLTRILFFCLFMSLTITLHELGHYGVAKVFHVKARKFVIFLDWGFHLFSTHDEWFLRLFPSMKDKVDIRIGWLPVAAYVLFKSSDDDDTAQNCIDLVSAWKKFLIWFAGPFVNYVFFIAAFFALVCHHNPNKTLSHNVELTFQRTTRIMINYVPRCAHNIVKYYTQKNEDKPATKSHTKNSKKRGGWYYTVREYPGNWQPFHLLQNFWTLNLIFFLFNLIPLPPLDGGNLIYCIYEMITGRRPNEKLLAIIFVIGFLILAALTLWGIGEDLWLDFR